MDYKWRKSQLAEKRGIGGVAQQTLSTPTLWPLQQICGARSQRPPKGATFAEDEVLYRQTDGTNNKVNLVCPLWWHKTSFVTHLTDAVFALNSAIHSYLIVSYASADGVSLDVGFYYMANAAGRLLGTACSGWIYQAYGIDVCLAASAGFLLIVVFLSARLPRQAKEISKLS